MTVTADETPGQGPDGDLHGIHARLEAAEAEAASLRVLLALRTHQYDQAWQAAQRGAADRDAVRETEIAQAAEAQAAQAGAEALLRAQEAERASAACAEAVARADARTEAVRTVLAAVLACLRVWGLDRRRFQQRIVQAARDVPDAGAEAERHAVLLAEARRVLGRAA